MDEIFDFDFYANHFMKIKTKLDGLQPFVLRKYQKSFVKYWRELEELGPVRIIVLKPRQSGFSTLVGGLFFHGMATREHYKGIALADKKGRTAEIASIYSTFNNNLPPSIKPMCEKDNTEEIFFDNPKKTMQFMSPGLSSGVKFETAQDPNAGRAGSRRFAHMSENAFYRYYREIDEGVQNSIPLSKGTAIIKESTANGRAGIGKPFYDLWRAAEAGETNYKPFFVAWYEVDDYAINPPSDFKPTKQEIDILQRHPSVSMANIMWRRMKMMEYFKSDTDSEYMTPEERFKQDYPLTPSEAFRYSGQPVFEAEHIDRIITNLTRRTPRNIAKDITKKDHMLTLHLGALKIFSPPREGKQYFIGADVAEGLAVGDSSSVCILDEEYNQVGSWHGKIDPDLFGHLLISMARFFNEAVIIPEKNNMGHTTVTTIRNEGYSRIYKKVVEDKVTRERSTRYGWVTTSVSKSEMLANAVARVRDNSAKILDIALPREMEIISRGDSGDVDLNGKDRVVAFCLAVMGVKHYREPIRVRRRVNMEQGEAFDVVAELTKKDKRKNDIFD